MKHPLHDQFNETEHPHASADPDAIVHRCKEMLFHYPTGRHLVDLLNFHQIPVSVERTIIPGYTVRNHNVIILNYADDTKITEMSFHLACALRVVELHMQSYLSPEMKDSRSWMHPHLSEPFEIMLVICKLAYDMNDTSSNKDVQDFIAKKNFEKIYHAYEQKMPYTHIEELMLHAFNDRR